MVRVLFTLFCEVQKLELATDPTKENIKNYDLQFSNNKNNLAPSL